MGGSSSAEGRRSPGKFLFSLEAARARSSNPFVTSARYHGEDGHALEDDYEVDGSALGEGMNGTVVLAIGRIDGQKYAVKRFPKRWMTEDQMKLLQREVAIYLSVDHPNIVALKDVYDSSEELALVMECCSGGELFEQVLQHDRLAEHEALTATQQMLRAVGYLHSHEVAHRDLKLENFIFESKGAKAPLKLIDFGLAKVWGRGMPKMNMCRGSLSYVSPEMLSMHGYTNKCDLWSVGITVFILLSGYMPFPRDPHTMKTEIQAGNINWRRKEAWQHLSKEAIDFVRTLLTFDPERRPDANMALAHPWLAQLSCPEVPRLSKQMVQSMQEYAGTSPLHRAALQLLARELLPEESRELSTLFLGLDRSNTGTISVHELADALQVLRKEQVDVSFWTRFSLWSSMEKTGNQSPSKASTADSDLQDRDSFCSSLSSSLTGTDVQEPLPLASIFSATPSDANAQECSPRSSSSSLNLGCTSLQRYTTPESPGSTTPVDADFKEAAKLFQFLDATGRGEVHCSDFIAALLGSQPCLRERAIHKAFARLDADRSGGIGVEDLRRVLGGPLAGMEPGVLLASSGAVLDARGEVGLEAFATLLQSRQGPALNGLREHGVATQWFSPAARPATPPGSPTEKARMVTCSRLKAKTLCLVRPLGDCGKAVQASTPGRVVSQGI